MKSKLFQKQYRYLIPTIFLLIMLFDSCSSQKSNYRFNLINDELEAIWQNDQGIRNRIDEAEERGAPKEVIDSLLSIMSKSQKEHSEKLDKIISQIGQWPGERFSENARMGAWGAYHHSSDCDFRSRLEKYLTKGFNSGNVKGELYALAIDRTLWICKRPTRYGTIPDYTKFKKTGKLVLYPVEDYLNINQRRKEVGLPTIEEFAKNNGIILE